MTRTNHHILSVIAVGAALLLAIFALTANAQSGWNLSASATHVQNGQPVTLTINGTEPDGCAYVNFNGNGDTVVPASNTTTTYTVSCGSNGSSSVSVQASASGPPQPPSASISANPSTITAGSSSLISWNSARTTSCTVTVGGTTIGNGTSGSVSVSPNTTSYYQLNCVASPDAASGGTTSGTAAIIVNPPEFNVMCSVNPQTANINQSVNWFATPQGGTAPFSYLWTGVGIGGMTGSSVSTSYTTSGEKYGAVKITDSSSAGGVTVTPTEGRRCTGPAIGTYMTDTHDESNQTGGMTQAAAKQRIESEMVAAFGDFSQDIQQNPQNYCVQGHTTLDSNPNNTPVSVWTFQVDVHSGTGTRATDGNDYQVNAQGGGDQYWGAALGQKYTSGAQSKTNACEVPVNVLTPAAPTASLTANPISVTQGQSSTLTHSCANATTASIDQGVGAVTPTPAPGATASVTPGATTTYTLTCTGAGGTATASVQIAVTPALPDLTASNIGTASGTTGSPVSLSATISNTGIGGTGAGFTNLFQRATNSSGANATDIGTAANSALAAAGSNATSISYSFPSAGTWYVRVCADKSSAANGGSITESNESNNCSSAWRAVTITDPVTPTDPTEPPVTLTCNVSPSTVPATGGSVTYTVSGGSTPYAWNDAMGGSYTTGSSVNRSIPAGNGQYGMNVSKGSASASCPVVTAGTGTASCGSGSATISADPTRVRQDNNTGTTLTWSASGVDTSCAISGPGVNQTVVPTACNVAQATLRTPQITAQSVYRISCDSGESVDEVIVNLIPKFIEF